MNRTPSKSSTQTNTISITEPITQTTFHSNTYINNKNTYNNNKNTDINNKNTYNNNKNTDINNKNTDTNNFPFLKISSFDFLISKDRLNYIKTILKTITNTITNYNLTISLKNNLLTLSTHKTTKDPYAFIQCKSYIFCLLRGASLTCASKLFNENFTYEIVDIKLKKKLTFINRRNRLIRAVNPLMKLTETDIFIYGSTVTIIGIYKNVYACVKIILATLNNKHPLFLLKELMANKLFSVRKELENVDWKDLLPEVKKKVKLRKCETGELINKDDKLLNKDD
ncbi:KRR1 small subunit processome component like protein [Cucumispora dikerogammari]|nr:KRR1 small subunit processome component like protein [Cucumispora dikerogammari]